MYACGACVILVICSCVKAWFPFWWWHYWRKAENFALFVYQRKFSLWLLKGKGIYTVIYSVRIDHSVTTQLLLIRQHWSLTQHITSQHSLSCTRTAHIRSCESLPYGVAQRSSIHVSASLVHLRPRISILEKRIIIRKVRIVSLLRTYTGIIEHSRKNKQNKKQKCASECQWRYRGNIIYSSVEIHNYYSLLMVFGLLVNSAERPFKSTLLLNKVTYDARRIGFNNLGVDMVWYTHTYDCTRDWDEE